MQQLALLQEQDEETELWRQALETHLEKWQKQGWLVDMPQVLGVALRRNTYHDIEGEYLFVISFASSVGYNSFVRQALHKCLVRVEEELGQLRLCEVMADALYRAPPGVTRRYFIGARFLLVGFDAPGRTSAQVYPFHARL